jgi:hypothetical protein
MDPINVDATGIRGQHIAVLMAIRHPWLHSRLRSCLR